MTAMVLYRSTQTPCYETQVPEDANPVPLSGRQMEGNKTLSNAGAPGLNISTGVYIDLHRQAKYFR